MISTWVATLMPTPRRPLCRLPRDRIRRTCTMRSMTTPVAYAEILDGGTKKTAVASWLRVLAPSGRVIPRHRRRREGPPLPVQPRSPTPVGTTPRSVVPGPFRLTPGMPAKWDRRDSNGGPSALFWSSSSGCSDLCKEPQWAPYRPLQARPG